MTDLFLIPMTSSMELQHSRTSGNKMSKGPAPSDFRVFKDIYPMLRKTCLSEVSAVSGDISPF